MQSQDEIVIGEIDRFCEPLYKKYLEPYKIINDEAIIYHYTSFEGLKGILSSKRLWLTDFRHLNDPSEINYSLSIIEQQINRKTSPDKNILKNYLLPGIKLAIEKSIMATISFCESNKADYLPAWRWYGNDGIGFTIGIRTKLIQQFRDNNNDSSLWFFNDYKINYARHSDFQDYVDKILDLAVELFKKSKSRTILHVFASYLLPLLPQCKHSAYQEECEYRFVMFENLAKSNVRIIKSPHGEVREYDVRSSKKEGYPFVNSIPIVMSEIFQKDNIVKIGIGPACHAEKARCALIELLQNEKFNDEEINKIIIYNSEIPYRR